MLLMNLLMSFPNLLTTRTPAPPPAACARPTSKRFTTAPCRRRAREERLERVERLLALLGDPQEKLRTVQVVGTNGKGTTAVALTAALTELGQPAGAYLSPHVLSYTERVTVGGVPVSEERFAAAMSGAA